MNKQAQFSFEDINPAYAGLAVLGGFIAFFVAAYAKSGKIIPFVALILGTIITYLYLTMTDR
ncbi:hypothetical protein M0R04_14795 [Candidatus Dojkabacteria bacterium]|jgi:hypothetical protein|nr:hypothetical protein [Candidatus Dojkabacteria bacterium]